eukprot:12046-Heterococcus_DN1.PRE.1
MESATHCSPFDVINMLLVKMLDSCVKRLMRWRDCKYYKCSSTTGLEDVLQSATSLHNQSVC